MRAVAEGLRGRKIDCRNSLGAAHVGALDLTISVVDAPTPSGVDLEDVLARFDQDSA